MLAPKGPDGVYLVQVDNAQHRWQTQKRFYVLRLTDAQRNEFETLVEDTVRRIESGLFLPHSGIRFPQNPCTTCPFLGLCLEQRDLVESGLIRKPGVDLGLFDELAY